MYYEKMSKQFTKSTKKETLFQQYTRTKEFVYELIIQSIHIRQYFKNMISSS